MPFKAPENPKCPKCGKSVYHAEARVVGDISFHKECYKCSMCNKMLDSTNSNCHENILYCKTCHGRKFGPKGYGFGGGAAGLSMDTGAHLEKRNELAPYKPPKAKAGEGCPRCGGKVFAAEEMLAKGKSYHRTCFNCKNCRKPLDSVVHCDGPDKEVYCKVCYGKKFGPKGYGFGHGGGTLQCDPDASPIVRPHGNPDAIIPAHEGETPCPRCGGRVFMAELMMAKGRPFHKKCFKCRQCKRPLDSMVHCDAPDGEIYCKLCYAKKYGPKGYGFAAGGGGVLTAENIPGGESMPGVNPGSAALDVSKIRAEDGKGCPRCGGKVFMAEEINARGRPFHKRCYNCCLCHRPLDSMTGCDAPDGEVYCKLCYAKKYGPKGYGFAAGGGGVLVAENIAGGEDDSKKKRADLGRIDTSKIKAEEGKGCPRCGGKVFMAEEIHVRNRSFHKRCYNCLHCHRPLDSVVGCDAPDGEIYCKLCYAKKYGPKGYGFAAGSGGVLVAENIPGGGSQMPGVNPASAAIDTTSIPAAPGEGCPRCGGKVFTAEERLSRGKKWHKRCYNCLDCTRPLDAMVFCDGPDGEIYCKLCYAKRFGPKGYGFAAGAGGVLVPENIAGEDEIFDPEAPPISKAPAFTVLDVTKIPAREGQARCPRCGGAVFQAESMPCRGKEWHKRCYNCCECHRPLDSMLSCDAPDGEIYCKLCYAKRHGPKGYGYGHVPALVSIGSEDGVPIPTDIRQFGFGAKGPKNWVPPIPNVNNPNQPHGPPPSSAPSLGAQVQHSLIEPPKPMPISAGMPIPRGFESVGQQGSQQVTTQHVTIQGGSQQETSTKVITQQTSSSSSVQEFRTVTRVERVEESRSRSASSSSSSTVTRKVVHGGVAQGEAVPIVAGIHIEEGEAVPIVAGVVPQGTSELMPDIPSDMIYPAEPSHDNMVYPPVSNQGDMVYPSETNDTDMTYPDANTPPEMLGHQSSLSAQQTDTTMQQQSDMYDQQQYAFASQQSSMSSQQQQSVMSSHSVSSMSVKMQQMHMSSEFSSSSQFSSEPQPMLEPPTGFEPEPDFEPQPEFEDLHDPGEEAMHEAAYEDDYLPSEDAALSPGDVTEGVADM